MRIFFIILSFMTISLSALADKCKSTDLNEEQIKIEKMTDLSVEEKTYVMESAKSVKVSEILACSALRQEITREDARFAVFEIEKDRLNQLMQANKERENIKSLLQSSEMNPIERDIYTEALSSFPNRIKEINGLADAVISHILRSAK